MVWHIGNTTVRTPYRLKGALTALQGTQLNGNLHGKENEIAFAKLLNDTEVVEVQRLENNPDSDVSDLGRKWRSALSQLGFITHKLDDEVLNQASSQIKGLSARPFEITPNGYRLIQSEQTTAQQECFLRSLLAYKIPSVIEFRYDCKPFNPLKFTIDIIFGLKSKGADTYLSFPEFALYVQTSTPETGIEIIVNSIIAFRERKKAAAGKLRDFYREEYKAAVIKNDPQVEDGKISTKAQTLDDYTDLTFRYLKATGIYRNHGQGITLNPIKEEIAHIIHSTPEEKLEDLSYLVNLWVGSKLPTDEVGMATQVVVDLSKKIEAKGAAPVPSAVGVEVALQRHILEEQLLRLEETEYYKAQSSQTEDISAWLTALISGSATLPTGEKIRIPKGEAPAYFEWAIWRAFLAINSLVNQPWEARRFQVDQDFLPIGNAPGSGPDMVFEFENAIVVVEVTLTNSSRQEAAEGEPVRRHVAKYAEEQGGNGKIVFGLFLAINIDSNTAHTFRTGDWYLRDDNKINLHIVPIKLEDFQRLFLFGKEKLDKMPAILQEIFQKCRMQANQDAPVWKRTISNIIEQTTKT